MAEELAAHLDGEDSERRRAKDAEMEAMMRHWNSQHGLKGEKIDEVMDSMRQVRCDDHNFKPENKDTSSESFFSHSMLAFACPLRLANVFGSKNDSAKSKAAEALRLYGK